MSYVDAAINRLKDEAERKAATPPTPDAGVTDAVLKEFGTVLCPEGMACKDFDCIAERLMAAEIIRLRAQLAAAKADGEQARSVVTAMRRYLPTPGENPGETRISLREWEPLMQRIEALDAARTGAR